MNYVDILLLIPPVYGLIRGLFKGLVKEVASLAALLVSLFVAYFYSNEVELFLSSFITASPMWISVFSYLAIFITIGLLFYLLATLLTRFLQFVALGALNRVFGGVFGAAKWIMILLLLVYLFKPALPSLKNKVEPLKQSVVLRYLEKTATMTDDVAPAILPFSEEQENSNSE